MLRSFGKRFLPVMLRPRWLSAGNEGEKKIASILREKFPKATTVHVEDVSGGCGAMYQIHIEAEDFAGKRMVAQHRMVNEALADEVKKMHGLRISTAVPETNTQGNSDGR
ncbi:bolA-like protein 3 [Amphiura filiformis]|uniref:bolA-like protein 3 n=1 Tax=Amphiura filiformis TaxID=82378 RepID=UPI003B223C4A